jgi:hypothetical protein
MTMALIRWVICVDICYNNEGLVNLELTLESDLENFHLQFLPYLPGSLRPVA